MIKQHLFIIKVISLAVLLGACSGMPAPTAVQTPTPRLLSYDELSSLLPDRIEHFKGALALSIEENKGDCYDFGEVVPIKMVFENLINLSIILHAKFSVAPSNYSSHSDYTVFPEIATEHGESITYGPFIVDGFSDFSSGPSDFIEIPPQGTFETKIKFYFPDTYKGEDAYIPALPGKYLLKVIYRNYILGPFANARSIEQFDWNAWVGEVQSNQIEICMQNP